MQLTEPPSPLSTTDEGLDAVLAGDRLIVLRAFQDGVAYDPATDRWETVASPGCGIRTISAVWTGEVIMTQRFAFDPSTGECRELPPAPPRDGWPSNLHEFGAVAWTGTEFLVWGAAQGPTLTWPRPTGLRSCPCIEPAGHRPRRPREVRGDSSDRAPSGEWRRRAGQGASHV